MRIHWLFRISVSREIPDFRPSGALVLHAARRTKTLTASLTAKVTPEEEKLFKAQAREAGLTSSEWCRQALIRAASCAPETRLVLSEVMALRTVLLTFHTDLLQGHELTEERIAAVLKQADTKKYAMADNRIEMFRAEKNRTEDVEPVAS
jgi:hypothetical protein